MKIFQVNRVLIHLESSCLPDTLSFRIPGTLAFRDDCLRHSGGRAFPNCRTALLPSFLLPDMKTPLEIDFCGSL